MIQTRHLIAVAAIACASGRAVAQIAEAAGVRALVPFELGRFDMDLSGTVQRFGTAAGPRTPFSFESRLRLPFGDTRAGAWLSARVEGSPEIDSMPKRPLLSAGVWRTLRGLTVSIGASSHAARGGGSPARVERYTDTETYFVIDSIKPLPGSADSTIKFGHSETRNVIRTRGDSGQASRVALWSDVEGRVAWSVRRLALEAVVGGRRRIDAFAPALWARLGGAYPLSDRLSFTAVVGSQPAQIGIGVPSSSFASVALRVRASRPPGAGTVDADGTSLAAFSATREPGGRYRVVYLAPHAAKVELSGDFDSWRPVTLTETRPGVWEVLLPLTSGTYHVNVRIDGGRWMPPLGLPRVEDDFNGAVGILVIR